jgi:hypothetical protein
MKCPLSNLLSVEKNGLFFYDPSRRYEHYPPWFGDCPSREQLQKAETGKMFKMTIDGERWQRVPLDVTWELAEDDANYPCEDLSASPMPTPRHIHCNFKFLKKTIHIDFVRFISWGPLSGFEEFQFFMNGTFQSRGGYSVCYGMARKAMPACLRTTKFAIIAHGGFSGAVLPPFNGLSAWLIEPKE